MVYVMHWRGGYKIGYAANIKVRYSAKAMRKAIIMTMDGGLPLESQLHAQFNSKRVEMVGACEVFALDADDLAILAAMPGSKPYSE